jgi:hypothetical protein
VSLHPLVDASLDAEVKKAAGFRRVAAELTGEILGGHYRLELANAPRRHEGGKRYFVAYNRRLAAERRPRRDDEHLALALAEWCSRTGARLELPDDAGDVCFVHAQVPLRSAAPGKSAGGDDPNRGVGTIALIGLGRDDRLVVGHTRYLAPSVTRGRTGDTPLRAFLEGLANAAAADANRAALGEELAERVGRTPRDSAPMLLLIGSPRYWELCRKREAQKGAAWIKELERLAKETEEASGVEVHFLACRLEGDPGWSYGSGAPVLDGAPKLVRAWEYGAGRVRPKPKARPKPAEAGERPVEADLSRPVRGYFPGESYQKGDRIDHRTLGLGVVQGIAGSGKIAVLFGDRRSVLIHERAGAPRAS